MPHGHHIYAKEYDMSNPKICAYSQSDHALPNCKCVLRCCAKCPSINITDQETDDQYPDTSPSISFHIYHLIARCTKHGRLPLTGKNICLQFQQYTASGQSTKMYTKEQLVMMETTISNFHTSFYIPSIQWLAFHIPHIHLMGTNQCGDSLQTAFMRHKSFQDVLCCCDYAESVASFSNQNTIRIIW